MNYIKVRWKHSFSEEPAWVCEVFADATLGDASSNESCGDTRRAGLLLTAVGSENAGQGGAAEHQQGAKGLTLRTTPGALLREGDWPVRGKGEESGQ